MSEGQPSSKQLPKWLIVAAAIATAGATLWGVMQTQGVRWPGSSASAGAATASPMQGGTDPNATMAMNNGMPVNILNSAPNAMNNSVPPAPAGSFMDAPNASNQARPVAGLPGVPIIMWGSQRPHPDRGACTNCHTVVQGGGVAVPAIFSFSVMPHEYRGVCSNCHQLQVGSGQPVAGLQAMPGQAPARRPPNEADWRGMEVRQVTQGVVVTQAEGTAARSGVQPGDVVQSINGRAVANMGDFVQITQNGQLPVGTAIVRRDGQRLAFELQKNAPQNRAQMPENMQMGNAPMARPQMGGNLQAPGGMSAGQAPMGQAPMGRAPMSGNRQAPGGASFGNAMQGQWQQRNMQPQGNQLLGNGWGQGGQ